MAYALLRTTVKYLKNGFVVIPDRGREKLQLHIDDASFIKFLKTYKAKDNKNQPRSKRKLTYSQILSDIKDKGHDTHIYFWDYLYPKTDIEVMERLGLMNIPEKLTIHESNSDKYNLNKTFIDLNKKVFNNELKLDFPLRWGKTKNKVGHVVINTLGKEEVSILEFMITNYYNMTLEQFESIMLHEMIHVYIFQKKIKDNNIHGREFNKKMDFINSKGYNVSRTEDPREFEIDTETVSNEELQAIIIEYEKTSDMDIIIFKQINSGEEMAFYEVLKNNARSMGEGITLSFLTTSNPLLRKYKIARSLKTALSRQYALYPDQKKELQKDINRVTTISKEGIIDLNFRENIITLSRDRVIEGILVDKGSVLKEYDNSYYYVYVDMLEALKKDEIKAIKDMQSKIPKDIIYNEEGFGIEDKYHITSFYGLKENIEKDLSEFVANIPSIDIKIKDISYFDNSEDYSVAKYDIESKALQDIFKFIKDYDNDWEYPDYNPHMTISYILPKSRIENNDDLIGKTMEIDTLKYMYPDEKKIVDMKTKSSMKENLQEMPHFQTNEGNVYDLYLELHVGDSAEDMVNYIISLVHENPGDRSLLPYLIEDDYLKSFFKKYYNEKVYDQLLYMLRKEL